MIIEKLNFSTIMDIIKLIGLAIGVITLIKQRSEVIIAKYKQKQAEARADKAELIANESNKRFEFIGETLLKVVQASKMNTEDKTKVTEEFLKIKGVIPEVIEDIKEVASEVTPQIVEIVEGIKGVTSGIINRD